MSGCHGETARSIGQVVTDLRKFRETGHWALPSRERVTAIVDQLLAVLFPRHFGPPGLSPAGAEGFVAYTLAAVLPSLCEQLRLELLLASEEPGVEGRAGAIAAGFIGGLPEIRSLLETDILAAYEGDPAARSVDEVVFCYPGIRAVISHRLANRLYRLGAPLMARIISEAAHSVTGIDIHPGAEVGSAFFIDHGTGVVIGETAVIGRHVRIYQTVTLGARSFQADETGALVKGIPRHPIIEDDVVIYAGATVLGRVTIGRGSVIGGNVWLTRSIPPGTTIAQAQPRSEAFAEGAGI